jgi:hypothetical protein
MKFNIYVVGTFVALSCMILLAVFSGSFFEYDHFKVYAGIDKLDGGELEQYLSYFKFNLSIDSIYLFGHMFMWIGLGLLVKKRNNIIGILIIVSGMLCVILDFSENILRWVYTTAIAKGADGDLSLAIVWNTIIDLSWWQIYITVVLVMAGLPKKGTLNIIYLVIGLTGLILAATMYYLDITINFIWLLIWHGYSCFYLGKENDSL